jgi:uncharacterized protein (TIGR03083 family)
MPRLDHERYCSEIIAQTGRLREIIRSSGLSLSVPTCPDWSLGELATHVGGCHRWAATVVRTKARGYVEDEDVPDHDGPGADDAAALDVWLEEGASLLAATLLEAGPDAEVWTWREAEHRAGYWGRRMTHETVIHLMDAALAVGADFAVPPEVAADTMDEFLETLVLTQRDEDEPGLAELRRPTVAGRSIRVDATDIAAEWLIELGDTGFMFARAHAEAAVVLRGPLTDVLRVMYRRSSADSDSVEVLGDSKLLSFWLERTEF